MSPSLLSNAGILTINAGSSSIKFAFFRGGQSLLRTVSGQMGRIGLPGTELTVTDVASQHAERTPIHASDHAGCLDPLMEALEKKGYLSAIQAVGHRVVHGGDRYNQPARVTPDVLAELRRLSPYDPEHLPAEISLIEAFSRRHPAWPQVACFDTAFHASQPDVATRLPLPRHYHDKGYRRYGFHGLNYEHVVAALPRLTNTPLPRRLLVLHLGNGASACAIRDAVHGLGLAIRVGVHTGECEVVEGKLSGLAVVIGSRVPDQASNGEVLVSGTVRDLVNSSGTVQNHIKYDSYGNVVSESNSAIVYSHGAMPLGPVPGIGTVYVPDRTDWRPVRIADRVGVHWDSTV